jgi:5-methylcytosine-specific restriction protein A
MTLEQFETGTGGTYTETGGTVAPDIAEMLRCDAAIHRLLIDGRSAILDYGRSVRSTPVDLYNAILARDQHCRWPGCNRPASHCDAHHVQWWERDGRTGIENLVLLCRRHHRRLHHTNWQAKPLPDGTLEITDPDGHTETTTPPGPIPQQFWPRPDGGPARRTAT